MENFEAQSYGVPKGVDDMSEAVRKVEDVLHVVDRVHNDPESPIRGYGGDQGLGVGEIGALLDEGHEDVVVMLSEEGERGDAARDIFHHLTQGSITPKEILRLAELVSQMKRGHASGVH
ncbi:MAG: hypothetical protein A3C84_04635 [Candidatus Ryanbacteria bacterium RIFCSPHIGHO2_02_FULL_48_12]|uniref:Uncharacterized protein n=1 Tax=Candidatus Ryanbacteria bacterium RIFCSPHIGHO2_01_FULL_48_27 TaxID=1802115 RepID=A0A1G2G6T6_9BACT|nr:MAG: hypothetical protein A2756_02165 [Candidatus Ryanbacteria bacterium RIFCSPHIGHO2_01_FULL_48_27]OGZ49866.1 MAG: hypothetical protein A3C84_04635 [Candidatus Ryanbacteria bacterium RIFCSPHIGHO2_02_FULL_48_12]